MVHVLAAKAVRIDVAGVPAVDGLSLATSGKHVLVLGAPRALFEAAAALRATQRGELRVDGMTPLDAIRAGAIAGAPCDPPMPAAWKVRQYVVWSARLAGHPRTTAASLADDALALLQLSTLAGTKLGHASRVARRATVVAAALATGAGTLLVEDPFEGLPQDTGRALARAVARALEGRRSAFFAPRVSLDSPLALEADEALVVDGSQVSAQGAPAEIAARERAFALSVTGDVRAFADAVQAGGARLLAPPDASTPARLSLELGSVGTAELLRIAAASNAVVLELRPIARTFA